MLLEAPIRGVAPMLIALRKLQASNEHLTPLHPEFLMLCLLAKCYKAGQSILEDDIFEVDQPRDLFLYCYYGFVSFSAFICFPFFFCLIFSILFYHLIYASNLLKLILE